FSSRRRHTISYGDWSSDVCSSDLQKLASINFDAARAALENALTQNRFNPGAFASAFELLNQLQAATAPDYKIPSWRTQLPLGSAWWFLVERYFAQDSLTTTGFVTTNA